MRGGSQAVVEADEGPTTRRVIAPHESRRELQGIGRAQRMSAEDPPRSLAKAEGRRDDIGVLDQLFEPAHRLFKRRRGQTPLAIAPEQR
jgi:hypothetical protein